MSQYWKRSRVTKALTDASRAGSFPEAEARLDAVQLDVIVGPDQLITPAGQAAVLTAIATAHKCFGRVILVAAKDAPLIAPLPLGNTLLEAARRLGAETSSRPSPAPTHSIRIGTSPKGLGWNLRCWWDRWLSGTRSYDDDQIGDSRWALSGVFAGATAVRQVFACVLSGRNVRERDVAISLWTPWKPADLAARGPEHFDVPDKLWLLGLGHLGQAFIWNLCFVGGEGERFAVLQDDQIVGEENEATSLLVLPGGGDMGKRKTRVAAPWLEACGWRTELVERRHHGDIAIAANDPPYLLSGLDRLQPRLTMARHGFDFMLDAGIGHGAGDFEGIQFRTIAKGQSLDELWCDPGPLPVEEGAKKLLGQPAYVELEQSVGQCGTFGLAQASVAVPFVGAAAGAITISQAIRLASLQVAPLFLQVELSSPEMATLGGFTAAPETNLGSFSVHL